MLENQEIGEDNDNNHGDNINASIVDWCVVCDSLLGECVDQNNHQTKKVWKCNTCSKISENKNSIKKHKCEVKEKPEVPETTTVLFCIKCEKIKEDCDDPENHTEEHKELSKYRCKKCNSLFDLQTQYNEHTCAKD